MNGFRASASAALVTAGWVTATFLAAPVLDRDLERAGPEPAAELLAAHDVYTSRAGKVPEGALRRAVEHKRTMEPLKALLPGANGQWSEYGRGPLNCAPSFCSARVDNFAYDPERQRLFAAIGTGGIWMSEAVDGDPRTLADHWVSVGDKLPTQVNGGVIWTPAGGGTLVAAGGESVMGNNGFMGLGAYWTTDLGETWTRSEGFPDGAQVYNARADLGNPQILYIASSKGLFRSNDAGRTFVNARLPTHNGDTDCAGVEDIASACQFTNMATDVIVKAPGGATDQTCSERGCPVIAALGWRAGYQPFWGTDIPEAQDNGLYRSDTGEPGTFTKLDVYAVDVNSPIGLLPQNRIGRIEMGNAMGPEQDHNYVYALVQDSVRFNEGYQPFELPADAIPRLPAVVTTAIGGLYASPDFGTTWYRMADTNEIAATPGSLGLLAGVQAWYNEWIAIDPTRQIPVTGIPTRMTFGLEEVFQNLTSPLPAPLNGIAQQGPQDFMVIGAYSGLVGTSTHPDQHVGLYIPTADGGVCLIVGNDGGVFKQCVGAGEEMTQLGWGTGNNDGFYALLPYGIGVAKDGTVWWGLQDNGSGHIEPDSREIIEDFGADGFFAEVDPDNSDVSYTESQNGGLRRTTDRGQSSQGIAPDYTRVNFANWFSMDPLDAQHMVTAAGQIYETLNAQTVTGGGWIQVFDTGTNPDTGAIRTTTVMDVQGDAIYAGFCGDCGYTRDQTVFQNGIATNVGGDQPRQKGTPNGWHFASAQGLENRFIAGMEIDYNEPRTVYVTLAGYMANIRPAGSHLDANPNIGAGSVFKSTDAGETFANISGNLPNTQVNSIVLRGEQLIVGTDIGAFISSDTDGTQWAPLGNGLPNVPINYIRLQPGKSDTMFAATFGRGVWSYVFEDGPPVEVPTTPDVDTTRFGGALPAWTLLVMSLLGTATSFRTRWRTAASRRRR